MQHPLVVVVDDNTDYLSFITTLLAFAGYTVITCRRGAEAVPLICERRPNFVLLDIRMEYADSGFTVLAGLRAHTTTATTPVLVCSADIEALHEIAEQYPEPQTAILAKPFELADLLDTMKRIAGDNRILETRNAP